MITYVPADGQLKEFVMKLLVHHEHLWEMFPEFSTRENVDEDGVMLQNRIAFFFQDRPIRVKGIPSWFKIRKCNPLDAMLHDYDFMVILHGDTWSGLANAERLALVDEILSSLKCPDPGRPLAIIPPDASVHAEILGRHNQEDVPSIATLVARMAEPREE